MAAATPPPITPVPLPPGVRQVLLFGGTFDPPHAAHVQVPFKVRDTVLGPEAWILFVPAARNPLKSLGAEASEIDRLQMLRILIGEHVASADAAHVATWTDEIDRAHEQPGPTYTIDTINRLRAAVGSGLEIRLLIGSDQAASFHLWRAPRELFDQTRPIVM